MPFSIRSAEELGDLVPIDGGGDLDAIGLAPGQALGEVEGLLGGGGGGGGHRGLERVDDRLDDGRLLRGERGGDGGADFLRLLAAETQESD
jgi:hypothetical protein